MTNLVRELLKGDSNTTFYCPKCKLYPPVLEFGFDVSYEERDLENKFKSVNGSPKHSTCGTIFKVRHKK